MTTAADDKLSESVVSELKRLKLILDADAQTLPLSLAQGTVTSELWVRMAEKALDSVKKKGAESA
jgi:hypothetical protein